MNLQWYKTAEGDYPEARVKVFVKRELNDLIYVDWYTDYGKWYSLSQNEDYEQWAFVPDELEDLASISEVQDNF